MEDVGSSDQSQLPSSLTRPSFAPNSHPLSRPRSCSSLESPLWFREEPRGTGLRDAISASCGVEVAKDNGIAPSILSPQHLSRSLGRAGQRRKGLMRGGGHSTTPRVCVCHPLPQCPSFSPEGARSGVRAPDWPSQSKDLVAPLCYGVGDPGRGPRLRRLPNRRGTGVF